MSVGRPPEISLVVYAKGDCAVDCAVRGRLEDLDVRDCVADGLAVLRPGRKWSLRPLLSDAARERKPELLDPERCEFGRC